MSIQAFNSLKNKAKSIGRSGASNDKIIYLEDDKVHSVRLIPNKDYDPEDMASQFKFARVHYKSGKVVPRTMFSPISFGDPDPIQEFVDGELEVKVELEEYKYLKNMEPSEIAIAPAVVRGKENEGTKLFVFSSAQFQSLVEKIEKHFQGEEPQEIWDVEKGFDILIEIKSPKKTGKPNRTVEIDLARKATPLQSKELSDEVVKELLENQPDWTEAYPKAERTQLESYLASALEEGDADAETEDYDGDESSSLASDVADVDPDEEEEILNNALEEFEKASADEDSDSDEEDDDMPF